MKSAVQLIYITIFIYWHIIKFQQAYAGERSICSFMNGVFHDEIVFDATISRFFWQVKLKIIIVGLNVMLSQLVLKGNRFDKFIKQILLF